MIQRVLVIGAGNVGQHIAIFCKRAGFDVSVIDPDPEALYRDPESFSLKHTYLGDEPISVEEVEATLKGIRYSADPAEFACEADLVIESVPENLKLKRNVMRQFDALCPPSTIFATNASAILPSQLAAASGRPDRLAALHFANTFVELMPHAGTSPEVMDALRQFAKKLGQLTIHLNREHPGLVLNTVLMPTVFWSVMLVANGVTSIEDVDRTWMRASNAKSGPFGMIDWIGLDSALMITRQAIRPFRDKQLRRNAAFFEHYVKEGRLGISTHHGFYRYPNPAYIQPDFLMGGSVDDD